jgi:hypothetical protein
MQAARPLGKGASQWNGVVGCGAEEHLIYSGRGQQPVALLAAAFGQQVKPSSRYSGSGVYQDSLASLRVLQINPTGVGQLCLARVLDRNRHDVMAGRETAERLGPVLGQEI